MIDPVRFPQLYFLLSFNLDQISPQQALKTYEKEWRWVNLRMMSNNWRMLLIELIDKLAGGIFEPWFDEAGDVRKPVIEELEVGAG